jgi:hypothetical protein
MHSSVHHQGVSHVRVKSVTLLNRIHLSTVRTSSVERPAIMAMASHGSLGKDSLLYSGPLGSPAAGSSMT